MSGAQMKPGLAKMLTFSAVAVTAAVVMAAQPAQAASSYCNSSTCSLSNTSNSGGVYFEMPRGTSVSMRCWKDSQWWNGTNRWFYVDTVYGRNWMIATQVSNQTKVGRC